MSDPFGMMEGMDALLDTLREVIQRTREAVSAGLGNGAIRGSSDSDVLDVMVLAGELGRLQEALLIESAGEVARRSDSPERDLRLTTRMGCHDVSELVQRLTRVAPASAARLPALPAMRAALVDGEGRAGRAARGRRAARRPRRPGRS